MLGGSHLRFGQGRPVLGWLALGALVLATVLAGSIVTRVRAATADPPSTGPDSAAIAAVADCQGNMTVFGSDAGGNYLENVGQGTLTVEVNPGGSPTSTLQEPWSWNADGVVATFNVPSDLIGSSPVSYLINLGTAASDLYGTIDYASCDGSGAVSYGAIESCDGEVSVYAQDSADDFLQTTGTGTLDVGTTPGRLADQGSPVFSDDGTTPWTYSGQPVGLIAQFAGDPDNSYAFSNPGGAVLATAQIPADCAGVTLTATETCSGTVTFAATDGDTGHLQSFGSGSFQAVLSQYDPSAPLYIASQTLTGTWNWSSASTTIATLSNLLTADTSGNAIANTASFTFGADPTTTLQVSYQPPSNCPGIGLTASETCGGTATISATDDGTGMLESLGSGTFTLAPDPLISPTPSTPDQTLSWSWSSSSAVIATIPGLALVDDTGRARTWMATFIFGSGGSPVRQVIVAAPTNCPPAPTSTSMASGASPVVASLGGGAEVAAYRDASGQIWAATAQNGTWQTPAKVAGAVSPSDPSLVSPGDGTAQLYWRGNDGNLWRVSYASGSWSGVTCLYSGPLGSVPHAVIPSPGDVDVMWRGTDNNLWLDWSTAGAWHGPINLTTANNLASEPYPVVSQPGVVDVFWKGSDGNLWHKWAINGTWYGPQSLGSGPLGSEPHPVATTNTGVIDVFWRGSDNNLWHDWYVGGTWYGPQSLGSGPLGSEPHPVSPGDGTVQVYWEGTDAGMWYDTYSGTWSGPHSSGASALTSSPAPVAMSPGVDDVLWRGADGQPREDVLTQTTWSGQHTLT